MLRYVARRLCIAVPLALAAATLVFVLLESAPGDPTDLLLGDRPVPPEVRERLERVYGFDQPVAQRYLRWLGALCWHGELGWSHSRGRPVREALIAALPATMLLAFAALFIHVVVGIAIGVVTAAYQGHWPDRVLGSLGLVLYSMPVFWLAMMAVLALSETLGLFPASALRSVDAAGTGGLARAVDRLWHLALPASVLGLASAGAMARFVRAGLLESLSKDFIRAARARGLANAQVLVRHALRTALLPVVNLAGLSLPLLLSGSLVIEVVFAWPGMGRLTYDAIRAHDLPVVLATTLVASLLVVAGNLVADVLMAALDPRVRLAAETPS